PPLAGTWDIGLEGELSSSSWAQHWLLSGGKKWEWGQPALSARLCQVETVPEAHHAVSCCVLSTQAFLWDENCKIWDPWLLVPGPSLPASRVTPSPGSSPHSLQRPAP
ncbi:hypothetical protein H1C71_036235, partial [Ictidomys tridecemlineatus]